MCGKVIFDLFYLENMICSKQMPIFLAKISTKVPKKDQPRCLHLLQEELLAVGPLVVVGEGREGEEDYPPAKRLCLSWETGEKITVEEQEVSKMPNLKGGICPDVLEICQQYAK